MASTINADTSNGVIITPDTSGEIELQANGVTKAKVTANGLQDANGNSLRGGSYRNLIINGDMQIAQRGTSVSGIGNSADYKTVDRWRFAQQSSTGVFTMSQDTDVPIGQGFTYSVKMQCTTADTTLDVNDRLAIWQGIEGNMLQSYIKGTGATKATLSFWLKTNKTGQYNIELNDTDNIRHICHSFNVTTANAWQKITWVVPEDTGGSPFDNGISGGMYVNIIFGAGSNYQSGTLSTTWTTPVTQGNRYVGVNNLADSTSNYINITGVQLEVGEGASDFEFLPYDVQLQRCQRYYETGTAYAEGYTTINAPIYMGYKYKVTKRIVPALTHSFTNGANARAGATRAGYVDSFARYCLANATGALVAYESFTADAEL